MKFFYFVFHFPEYICNISINNESITGPTIMPIMPNKLKPPKTPNNITIGFILDLSAKILALANVSITLNIIPKIKIPIALYNEPSTNLNNVNGIHTMAGPSMGINTKNATKMPQTNGVFTPKIKKPRDATIDY